jgi:hypothetical protein
MDPKSLRSAERGIVLTALPAAGRSGNAPAFPLPKIHRFRMEFYEGGGKAKVPDTGASSAFRKRELAVWREVWKTPQACAWELESWRWPTIAEFCRLKTVVEMEPDANAALVAQLHRFRDQVGLTPAGLKENGWAIARDEVKAKRDEKAAEPKKTSARDRMKVVRGGDGA